MIKNHYNNKRCIHSKLFQIHTKVSRFQNKQTKSKYETFDLVDHLTNHKLKKKNELYKYRTYLYCAHKHIFNKKKTESLQKDEAIQINQGVADLFKHWNNRFHVAFDYFFDSGCVDLRTYTMNPSRL